MRLATAFLIGLVGFIGPGATQGQDEPVLYHPTRVGTKWTYRDGDEEHTFVVTGVDRKRGSYIVAVGIVGGGLLSLHGRVCQPLG